MLPSHTKDGIDRYVKDHCSTGSFLYAVLTNDLFGAIQTADEYNRDNLPDICEYIYTQTPVDCWGSVDKVNAWLLARGG